MNFQEFLGGVSLWTSKWIRKFH